MATKIIPVSDLRRKTSQLLKQVQHEGDVIYVTQYGRPKAVLLDYDYYETLLAQLEDLSDLASLEAAADEPARPYEEFITELGLSVENDNPVSVEDTLTDS